MANVNDFAELSIKLLSTDEVHSWSYGEVKKAETINHRTLKPEKGGLFCERVFGPTHDWECSCGKYKRPRYKGIICERCGVEVTRSQVRRERMGHIELVSPVTHVWFFKSVPSRLGILLDIAPKDLEKVIYYAAHMVIEVDTEKRHNDMKGLREELEEQLLAYDKAKDNEIERIRVTAEKELAEIKQTPAKVRRIKQSASGRIESVTKKYERKIREANDAWEKFVSLAPGDLIGDDVIFTLLEDNYSDYFKGDMGAEAIETRIMDLDLQELADELKATIDSARGQRKVRAIKRLKVVRAFLQTGNKPESMIIHALPVIPPDLRPMVQLDGGRFATSDLNDLYRRVIIRNNRLKRFIALSAPEIIINNEKRMLQESVDALFDNGKRGKPVLGTGGKQLKSISELLKGKQGRFRQNLLGKRVDYSGRSVIVVGPQLKIHQCGLPKQMALELFKPHVIKKLITERIAMNIKVAKQMVDRMEPEVWDILEFVISGHPVLLNRAPTLHRLGIQAFEPQLVEGKAIQLHPLVCAAFNADFDGDQMAVHLPLSEYAQAEARVLMLAANNLLKPADGRPVTLPTQDMIIGLYYLTSEREKAKGEGRIFSSVSEAEMAFLDKQIDLRAKIKIRTFTEAIVEGQEMPKGYKSGDSRIIETTYGRTVFNEIFPDDAVYINSPIGKAELDNLINDLIEKYPTTVVDKMLDGLKELGFKWASRSGSTISYADIASPAKKTKIIANYDAQAEKIQEQFDEGMITDDERRIELIDIWTRATDEVDAEMRKNFKEDNTILQMVTSGARGNWMQVRQIAGMRGLVANPKGEIIPRPIKSNYREGLSVIEYFIASHGARKGIADTALRTADSGFLTRRLVDVSQDIIIRSHDCGTVRGLDEELLSVEDSDGKIVADPVLRTSVYGRTLAEDVKVKSKTLAKKGDDISLELIDKFVETGVKKVKVRSVLTCELDFGICALCYGRSLATGTLVDIGEAVGIVAAQSIGEPGTQLTMRTFHTGGVASAADITQGLPRAVELFEARTPKGEAPMAEYAGTVQIVDDEMGRKIVLKPTNSEFDTVEYPISRRQRLTVKANDKVEAGVPLTEGVIDPKKLLRILGPRATQKHLVNEVQEVYRSQGVSIHNKHIEAIISQMLRRVTVFDPGDTELLIGELLDRTKFESINREAVKNGIRPAAARPELMGITKASLATASWLSAASFQDTTRVLTEAAIGNYQDELVGLKENVIIGKLIPAGTGLSVYRNSTAEPKEDVKDILYPSVGYDDIDRTTESLDEENFDIHSIDGFELEDLEELINTTFAEEEELADSNSIVDAADLELSEEAIIADGIDASSTNSK
ncbi:MAG: DNA-directed RNA polymerase subunit beta' [Bifidobacteriaceae bacterium]|jgi:DNA-directed RNA polymerase subunit beta'|nr:DNA-directed RNA polymerase subunit beta' [Bifidobacteriaceae bacterium]